jgi:hypothetical protein
VLLRALRGIFLFPCAATNFSFPCRAVLSLQDGRPQIRAESPDGPLSTSLSVCLGGLAGSRQVRLSLSCGRVPRSVCLDRFTGAPQVEDVIANMSNFGGPFISSLHPDRPTWLAVMEWWWKCHVSYWVFRHAAPPPKHTPHLTGH